MIHLTKIIAGLLVLAALALGGWAWWLGRQPAPVAMPVAASSGAPVATRATFAVVVTSRAVAAGEALGAANLRVEQLPVNPSDALHDVASATGRVAIADLGEGTPILEKQLVSGLALRLADGERAVAVKADEVMGVGSRVRPGDFVDVFFVLKADGREVERSQARLLLARQRVLAFGAASVDGVPAADPKSGAARSEPARTAVLAVAVQDVARLALGASGGRLLLALRAPGDKAVPDAALFAELPPALSPLPMRAGQPMRTALSGSDQAQGGLALPDLAGGRSAYPPGSVAATTASTGTNPVRVRPAPRPFAGNTGNDVEVFRGDKRETLSY